MQTIGNAAGYSLNIGKIFLWASDTMKTVVDDSIGFEAERDYNVTCSGRAEIDCGDFSVTEGADVALPVLLRGGQGTMGAVKFVKGVMKLIKSIA